MDLNSLYCMAYNLQNVHKGHLYLSYEYQLINFYSASKNIYS
jgi:hypothetical protein